MFSIRALYTRILSIWDWETVYFTDNMDKYAKIKGKLNDGNIITKTKFVINGGALHGSGRGMNTRNCSYELRVRSEDVYKASQIINLIK